MPAMQPLRSDRRLELARRLYLLALLTVVFTAPTAFAATKVVTDADKGGDVQIKAGDTLVVRLSSNPSTGYMWYIHPKSTALLRPTGQTQTKPEEPGDGRPMAVGRPIVQVFTFQPRRKGDGILLLHYVRSWEKPMLGEEQFTLHVVIE
jgi:inhibitor of cysteine peptidase